jgi:hypothetical protein
MAHVFEPAATGRSKCRGCGERIAAGELRFGETIPNPFADGETTLWFHPECGAYKRPEPFLEALGTLPERFEGADRLEAEARRGLEHRRLPRISGAERASSGRAQCRSCHQPIPKDAWRIPLVFFEEGRFSAAGFVHVTCCQAYFETTDVLPRLRRFAPKLSDDDIRALRAELGLDPSA